MARSIENTPAPEVLMNSMRAIGYNFKTALADIVDNSISASAKNIYIYSPINDESLFVAILDDGEGMNRDVLVNAMKYGSSRDNSSITDLGRFGLGLKSASLSQCRTLIVASKSNGQIVAMKWDLDFVQKQQKWSCLELDNDEIKQIPKIDKLKELTHGTLVVWQNFDIAYKKSNGHILECLMEEMDEAIRHLRLVFHRFLNKKINTINMYVNNDKLIGYDPFLEDNPKTDTKKVSDLTVENSIIKIQPFILPHQTDLTSKDLEKLGGIESFRSGQGFYIYRNERLIIYGTWFKLSSSNINQELYKYGRIKVDIPNTLDEMWEIDIKKQNAVVPKAILNNLKRVVSQVCNKSQSKIAKRTRLTLEKDDSKIWNKGRSKNNKDVYFVNFDNPFIKNFVDEFDDVGQKKVLRLIEIISRTLPFDDIYNTICNKQQEDELDNDIQSDIVDEGIAQVKRLVKITQKSVEDCFESLKKYEPFNDEKIYQKIWEKIKNE